MALMSPATTEADVDRHTEVFHELLPDGDLGLTRPCTAGRRSVTRSGHSRNDPSGSWWRKPGIPRLVAARRSGAGRTERTQSRRLRASWCRVVTARLQDPQVLDEIELYGELVIAASASDQPLSRDEIDQVLGLEQAEGDERQPG